MRIREFLIGDEKTIFGIYKRAFANFPWFENLSDEEIEKRWIKNSSYPGFCCLVSEINGQIVGVTWWDEINIDRLRQERGILLTDYVQSNFPEIPLIWERDLIVDPDFQGRGIGLQLRSAFLNKLLRNNQRKILVLTRMRQDNSPTLKLAKKLSYEPVGIKVPCSVAPGIFHEYWLRLIYPLGLLGEK